MIILMIILIILLIILKKLNKCLRLISDKKVTPTRLASFREQIRYLLTSKERLLLKKCLQNYVERRLC